MTQIANGNRCLERADEVEATKGPHLPHLPFVQHVHTFPFLFFFASLLPEILTELYRYVKSDLNIIHVNVLVQYNVLDLSLCR